MTSKPIRKDKTIILRASTIERAEISRRAKLVGMSVSRYLLDRGLQTTQDDRRAEPLAIAHAGNVALIRREYQAQGNNLNQIAKALNTAIAKGEAIDPNWLKTIDKIAKTNHQIALKLSRIENNNGDFPLGTLRER